MKTSREFRLKAARTVAVSILLLSAGSVLSSFVTAKEALLPERTEISFIADQEQVFSEVDKMPQFPGGDEAIIKFIAENVKYPADAKKSNTTGKVIVQFVVRKDCSISDVTVLKGVSPSIDAEAIRVVKTLPKFEKPGIKDGKPVSVQFAIPITFALK